MFESPPNIVVLGGLANDLKALEDVDDVIDTSAFDLQLMCDFVQFEGDLLSSLEVLDELLAEFLQALLLPVVREDFLLDDLLLDLLVLGGLPTAGHQENGLSKFNETVDEVLAGIRGISV